MRTKTKISQFPDRIAIFLHGEFPELGKRGKEKLNAMILEFLSHHVVVMDEREKSDKAD
jgi:hypothetical protein